MDELTTLHPDGVFLRREAIERGYLDKDLVAGLRSGQLTRIRQGAYVESAVWSSCDALSQHRLKAHAVLLSHGTRLVLSHTSAAVEHGLRLYGPDLAKIHVTTLDKHLARTTPDIVYHQGALGSEDIVEVNGCLASSPTRAALEAASLALVPRGLVILDSAIDLGLTDLESLHQTYEQIARWPGSRRLQIAVRLTRAGANSVGETLARYLMWLQHIPEPVLQFEVRDRRGNLVGRSDFAWPQHGVLGEFDGMQKYGRLLRDGESPADALVREKLREDRLRELTGYLMVRITWAELFNREQTGARIRDQLERGHRLSR